LQGFPVTPYYEDDWVTIYHGDCRDLIPQVTADALITDPPYGVGMGEAVDPRAGTGSFGLRRFPYLTHEDTYEVFVADVVPRLNLALARVRRAAIFTGPHITEQAKPDVIGGVYCPSGVGRHKWGFKTLLPVLFYGVHPRLQRGEGATGATTFQSSATAEVNGHPCPKPLAWMRWLVDLASLPGETVLDPFAGSGTTLRAAKDHNRRAVGIELEERYCEIAARRCAQDVFDLVVDRC
jgi:site-specific DNA-methyltransferase (adenine-specific)